MPCILRLHYCESNYTLLNTMNIYIFIWKSKFYSHHCVSLRHTHPSVSHMHTDGNVSLINENLRLYCINKEQLRHENTRKTKQENRKNTIVPVVLPFPANTAWHIWHTEPLSCWAAEPLHPAVEPQKVCGFRQEELLLELWYTAFSYSRYYRMQRLLTGCSQWPLLK